MKYMTTSFRTISLLAVTAIFMAACTSSRYASSTEYDDVYYTSADATTRPVAREEQRNRTTQAAPTYRPREVDNYQDYYYADDDFAFSRRLRRFNSPTANWRYYDPFFSNDLYFVMGTSYWNRWNNNGWYDWNRPRFGAFNPYDPFYSDPFFRGGFNSFGYGTFGYNYFNYDPWVGSFYGYNPGFGYGFNNGFNRGFYNGFNTGAGFGGNYYCPPVGYATSSRGFWNTFSNNNNRTGRPTTNTVRRQTAGNATSTRTGAPSTRTSRPTTRTSSAVPTRTDYTQPRTTTPRTRTSVTRPSNSSRTNSSASSRPATSTNRQSNTRTSRPSTSSSRPSTRTTRPSTSSRRPSTSSNRTTSPSRTYRPSSSSSRPSSSYRPSSSSRSRTSSSRPSSSSRTTRRP